MLMNLFHVKKPNAYRFYKSIFIKNGFNSDIGPVDLQDSEISKKLQFVMDEPTMTFHKGLFAPTDIPKKIFQQQLKIIERQVDKLSWFNTANTVLTEILSDKNISFGSNFISDQNKQMINYNTVDTKGFRFRIFIDTYTMLAQEYRQTNDYILLASIMGCLNEMLISGFLILDDIFDQSDNRRNKPCWYKKVGIQLASNDSKLLLDGIHIVMKEFFKNEPYYIPCLEIFQEVIWISCCSLLLADNTLHILDQNKKHCTWKIYKQLAFSEITNNALYLPITTAMQMAGYNYSDIEPKMLQVLDKMGYYAKMENDYSDRYGINTGKTLDEDIRLGKLTWLLLTALEYANPLQKNILKKYYGKPDPESVEAVVEIYEQIRIREIHQDHRQRLLHSIADEIKTIEDIQVQKILCDTLSFVDFWYNYDDSVE